MPSAWNWVTALSRVLMQWTEIAMSLAETVGEIVQAPPRRRTATLDTEILATGNDWSLDDEPLPFMARLKADHARRMAERARGLDSG